MRAPPFSLFAFLLVGCSNPGCACTPSPESGAGAGSTSGTEAAPADYEVHEWGLLRAARDGSTEVLRAGAVAPAPRVEPMIVDKPVLYFHARDPLVLRDVSVHVEGGGILESWPFIEARAANGNADIAWHDVSLGALERCEPSPLPTASAPPCSLLGPGAFCESVGLAVVRTDDASCVRTGGAVERFLFYRAESRTFTPPLRFAREQVYEDVRVTNDGDHPIPGVIVRIWSDGSRTRTLIAEPPAPHESVVIGHAFDDTTPAAVDDERRPVDRRGAMDESMLAPTVSGPGRDGVGRTMREIGLTTAEVGAFLRAWDTTLFSHTAAHAGATTDGIAVSDMPVDTLTADGDLSDSLGGDGELAPRESFLYFLPEPATDGVSTLQFSPAPRAVHRALAIWTALRSSGEGH